MKDPAALLYIDKWLTSTKEMKADERGWYLNLLLHQYDKGSLPNNIEELANLCDVRFSEYDLFKQKWEQVLKHKFEQNEEGRLINPVASETIRKREAFKEKRSESGKVGYIVKVARSMYKEDYGFIEYLKKEIDINEIDTKDKQVLKQVLKQKYKLYINVNEDVNININVNKDEDNYFGISFPDEFKSIIDEWIKYKKERRESYKKIGLSKFVKKLIDLSGGKPEIAQKIIDNSMANNYQGIFELKTENKKVNDYEIKGMFK